MCFITVLMPSAVFFVVTKVDICPAHVLQHSLATLSGILRKPGVKKKPFMVRRRLLYNTTFQSDTEPCAHSAAQDPPAYHACHVLCVETSMSAKQCLGL